MKLLKFALTVSAMILTSAFINAQNNLSPKQLLDKSISVLEKSNGIEADFNLKKTDNANAGDIYSFDGTFRNKGNKIYLTTPDAMVWFDGNTQWVLMRQNDEVTISTPSESEAEMFNPVMLMKLHDKGFKASSIGNKSIGKHNCERILLTANHKNSEWQKIEICINTNTYAPQQLIITDKNQGLTDITMSSFKMNMNYSDNVFVFDKSVFPNVEIIDIR